MHKQVDSRLKVTQINLAFLLKLPSLISDFLRSSQLKQHLWRQRECLSRGIYLSVDTYLLGTYLQTWTWAPLHRSIS